MTFPTFGALCDSIVAAIFREEGMPANYTNPGNLRACPWLPPGQPVSGGFWHPSTRTIGEAGAFHVVALHVAELNSLAQLIVDWAPPNENRTLLYLQNVQKWTGITDASVPLASLISPAPQAGQGVQGG